VAHEVRNNLVPVTLYLSLLRRHVTGDEECVRILDKVASGFTALDATVHDLLHFTSDRDPQLQTFPLAPLVDDVFAALAPQLAAQAIHTDALLSPQLSLTADRHMLRRAILNLVFNAMDAMPAGGRIQIRAAVQDGIVELEVADTGTGLSAETLARAFEPFFSTKSGGTGLGLAIVYRVAEVHGGEVTAANRRGGGASFTLRIPQSHGENRP
jgi:signal transduction histidine kinase